MKKLTHCNLRVVVNGCDTLVRTEIMSRCPIRLSCYSPGELHMLGELTLLLYIKKSVNLTAGSALGAFASQLRYTKALDLPARTNQGISELCELGILRATGKNRWAAILEITKKGQRHINRQSKRLRLAAEKLVYTDVLDRLGRAAG